MPKQPTSDPFAYTPLADLEPPTLFEETILWLGRHQRLAAVLVPAGILAFCLIGNAIFPSVAP
jgi:hypothetical protein